MSNTTVRDMEIMAIVIAGLVSEMKRRRNNGYPADRHEILAIRDAADQLHAIARELSRESCQARLEQGLMAQAVVREVAATAK
jgi:hypothetical protein